MKVSTTGFLVENLVTGLEMRYIVFFLCPVNPSLEFGGYKRTVDAQVPVAFRFPFTYLYKRFGIHDSFILFHCSYVLYISDLQI
jgi:hypothetical protein